VIPWSLSQTVAPAAKPLSIDRVLSHCRVELGSPGCTGPDIDGWINSAREQAELHTGRQLITATFKMRLDYFPCGHIVLPKPPCQSVTSIEYYDPDGALQTWAAANYVVDAPSGEKAQNARIFLATNASYPSTQSRPAAVIITFPAGYGLADTSVPDSIKSAMLLRISALNENREGSAGAFSARDLDASERLLSGFVTYMPELR